MYFPFPLGIPATKKLSASGRADQVSAPGTAGAPPPDPRFTPFASVEIKSWLRPWLNGWMDQDGTWHGGRRWSRPHCARWGPSFPPQKGAEPPIFGPSLLWPNGWMHQDATWYEGRPQPRGLWVRWGPSSPSQSPQFSAHGYCGRTAGWIKMALGMEVGQATLC